MSNWDVSVWTFFYLKLIFKKSKCIKFYEITNTNRRILETLIVKYRGRPVGIETIATTLGEEVDTIEDVYEPYLIQIGFISRTVRGRIALPAAYKHIGIKYDGDNGNNEYEQCSF